MKTKKVRVFVTDAGVTREQEEYGCKCGSTRVTVLNVRKRKCVVCGKTYVAKTIDTA